MKIDRKNNSRKKIFAAATVAVFFALAIGAYVAWASGWLDNSNVKNGVDYSPATESDKELNNDLKESLPDNKAPKERDNDTLDDTTASVTPVISAWGQPGGPGTDLRVNGYIPGIIESNGTCTLTLTKGSETATVSKASIQNAKDTSCGQLIIPYAQLSPGTWQAVLSYTSSSSEGSSTKTEIEVR